MKFIAVLLAIMLFPLSASADWRSTLVEYASNPVFDPSAAGDRAYYPTVLYDADGFGSGAGGPFYRLWYSTGNLTIGTAYSNDGIHWTETGAITGLTAPHHAQVLYDANGFGSGAASPHYRMWYWDTTAALYDVSSIHTAESVDGLAWINDQPLTNDPAKPIIVTQVPISTWNSGSYGPICLLYNASATNSGANPFDYSYAMFFDGTTGAFEMAGLGYSQDGVQWSIVQATPVLATGVDWTIPGIWGANPPWDSSYVGFGSVIHDAAGAWHYWYSGGSQAMGDGGIGYASSTDGITWTRDPANPFIAPVPGTWEDTRPYSPAVLYDENRFSGHGNNSQFKMWHTGRSPTGNYTLGYYGRDVATLTLVDGGAIGPSNDFSADAGEVVISQWKLTNNDIEPVRVTAATVDLSGALLDGGAIDTVAIYQDVVGDGVLRSGTDPLLGSIAPSQKTTVAMDQTIAMGEVQYWIITVTINEAAATGNELHLSISSQDELAAAGDQSKEAVKSFTLPIEGSIVIIANPQPSPQPTPGPTPTPEFQGEGGCALSPMGDPASSVPFAIAAFFMASVPLTAWRMRRSARK